MIPYLKPAKIRFTKHASDKFRLVGAYGFDVTEAVVIDTIMAPARVDEKDGQVLAVKPLDDEFALRVVYIRMNDNISVVTFYPVKRARYNV